MYTTDWRTDDPFTDTSSLVTIDPKILFLEKIDFTLDLNIPIM